MTLARLVPFLMVVFSSFLVIGGSAGASITSTATATHTLTIDSITGPAGLVTIEAFLFDLGTFADGEGATDATGSVTASVAGVDVPLFPFDSVFLSTGDSVTETLTAVAKRSGFGTSSADALALLEVIFTMDEDESTESATITMSYSSDVTATVTGSSAVASGFADTFALLDDVDDASLDFDLLIAEATVDSVPGGDATMTDGITQTVTLDIPQGTTVSFFFDASPLSTSTSIESGSPVIPEPASVAVWSLLGFCCCLAKYLRGRRKPLGVANR